MSRNVMISAGLGIVVIVALVAAFTWSAGNGRARTNDVAPAATASPATDAQAMRENSIVLGEPGSTGVTLVEFLDFECEGCLAAYPLVEQLREQYVGQVTFVARYFPLPGHTNAMNAAIAVEAANRQGQFEPMYERMFQTQTEWGEQQVSAAGTFRGFAEDLGLDMAAYDAAVADPATRDRVEQDVADGLGLGVNGTPTFFLDGQRFEPTSQDDFAAALDRAISASGTPTAGS